MSISEEQYELIATRRQSADALMWQSPFLSLTAQSFLFTIALDSGSSGAARLLSAGLALVASLACMQLMSKHRCLEVRDSKLLEAYEIEHGIETVHGRPAADSRWWLRCSSYTVWMCTLGVFALAAVLVVVGALCQWGWLSGPAG